MPLLLRECVPSSSRYSLPLSLASADRRRLHVRIVLQHFLQRREAAIHLFAAIGDGMHVADLAVLDAEGVDVGQALGTAEAQEHRDSALGDIDDVIPIDQWHAFRNADVACVVGLAPAGVYPAFEPGA